MGNIKFKLNKKEIVYLEGEALQKEIHKLSKRKEKYRLKLDDAIEKYELLSKRKQETNKGSVNKLIRLSNKVIKYKNELQYSTIRLEEIQRKGAEKLSVYKKVKNWFSRIPYNKQKVIWGLIFIFPVIIGLSLFFLPPVIKSFWWSFNSVSPEGSKFVINFVGFDNYKYLFQEYVIDGNRIFKVSLLMFVKDLAIDLPIILIFSLFIAVLLNKEFKGHKIVKAIFFIPVIYNVAVISSTLGGLGNHLDQGTTSTLLPTAKLSSFLLEVGIGTGFVNVIINSVDRIFTIVNYSGIQILIFVTALQSIPSHLYEAAKVEGATKYEKFWKITIPMVTPMILTAAIYTVIDSFARAPIFRYLTYATVQNRYGLASSIAIAYLGINLAIVGVVFLFMKGVVFYYDE